MPIFLTPEIDGLRILLVDDKTHGDSVDDALLEAFDTCFEVTAATSKSAMKLIRHQVFDAAVLRHSDQLDACQFVPLLLEMGPENLAVVVVGERAGTEMEPACLSVDADAYQCITESSSELMQWTIHRAVERRRLAVQAQRWTSQQVKHRQEDAQAGIHLVRSLRGCLLDSETLGQPPDWLVRKFLELLRAYVVSVASDLNDDIAQVVEGLQRSGVTLCEALMAHSLATEQLLLGMGHRPGRRVLDRSQLLAYALIVRFQSASSASLDSKTLHDLTTS